MILESHESSITDALGLKQALTVLNEQERQVIELRYLRDNPASVREAAAILQIHQSTLRRIESIALNNLKVTFS